MNISLLEQQAILLIYKYIDTIPSLKNVRKALDDGFVSSSFIYSILIKSVL